MLYNSSKLFHRVVMVIGMKSISVKTENRV